MRRAHTFLDRLARTMLPMTLVDFQVSLPLSSVSFCWELILVIEFRLTPQPLNHRRYSFRPRMPLYKVWRRSGPGLFGGIRPLKAKVGGRGSASWWRSRRQRGRRRRRRRWRRRSLLLAHRRSLVEACLWFFAEGLHLVHAESLPLKVKVKTLLEA